MKEIVSSQAYAAKGGVRCPVCGGDDLTGGPVEIDAGCAWQEMDCDHCCATWQDRYQLTGYASLVDEDGQALEGGGGQLEEVPKALSRATVIYEQGVCHIVDLPVGMELDLLDVDEDAEEPLLAKRYRGPETPEQEVRRIPVAEAREILKKHLGDTLGV